MASGLQSAVVAVLVVCIALLAALAHFVVTGYEWWNDALPALGLAPVQTVLPTPAVPPVESDSDPAWTYAFEAITANDASVASTEPASEPVEEECAAALGRVWFPAEGADRRCVEVDSTCTPSSATQAETQLAIHRVSRTGECIFSSCRDADESGRLVVGVDGSCKRVGEACTPAAHDPRALYTVSANGSCDFHSCAPPAVAYGGDACVDVGAPCPARKPRERRAVDVHGQCVFAGCEAGSFAFDGECKAPLDTCFVLGEEAIPNAMYNVNYEGKCRVVACADGYALLAGKCRPLPSVAASQLGPNDTCAYGAVNVGGYCRVPGTVCTPLASVPLARANSTFHWSGDGTCSFHACNPDAAGKARVKVPDKNECVYVGAECDPPSRMTGTKYKTSADGACASAGCSAGYVMYGGKCTREGSECAGAYPDTTTYRIGKDGSCNIFNCKPKHAIQSGICKLIGT